MDKLVQLRQEYRQQPLSKKEVNEDPFLQFKKWFNEAIKAKVNEPTAMVLSTVTLSGTPSSRVVLLKGLENESFQFYTNYESDKAIEISNNNNVSLLFFWPELDRQVRITGKANKSEKRISDEYFSTRPEGSKISAWASPQSCEIPGRKFLEDAYIEFEKKFDGITIERPPHWGGYGVETGSFEFWQSRPERLHDRILYVKEGEEWLIKTLAP